MQTAPLYFLTPKFTAFFRERFFSHRTHKKVPFISFQDHLSHRRYRINMSDFNRGGFNRGPKEMHKAVCSECKKECEVPFKPSGDRPIYCRECFQKRRKF
jgi:CxxC-x17-CxxC domain-containing protein